MIDEREIANMLRRFEGPPHAAGGRRPRRQRRRLLAAAALLVAAAAASAALVALLDRPESKRARPGGERASCEGELRFDGRRYVGNRVAFPVELGTRRGDASDPCRARRIPVVSVTGIDPRVALAQAGVRGTVYVAAGRCIGFDSAKFAACLREPLHFEDKIYVATRLLRPVARAGGLGRGVRGGESASVERLTGIDPSRAIAAVNTDREIVYLAPDVCPLPGLEQLERCLRAAAGGG
jgi:hypothetical protein